MLESTTSTAPHLATTTLTMDELCVVHVALASLRHAHPEFAERHRILLAATVDRIAAAIMEAA